MLNTLSCAILVRIIFHQHYKIYKKYKKKFWILYHKDSLMIYWLNTGFPHKNKTVSGLITVFSASVQPRCTDELSN